MDDYCTSGCPDDVCRAEGGCAWTAVPYRSMEVNPADGTITVSRTSLTDDQVAYFRDRLAEIGADCRPQIRPPADAMVTEYAQLMAGGSFHIRNPAEEPVYPLAKWIKAAQRFGGKVYTRRIIVVDDWSEVPAAPFGLYPVHIDDMTCDPPCERCAGERAAGDLSG